MAVLIKEGRAALDDDGRGAASGAERDQSNGAGAQAPQRMRGLTQPEHRHEADKPADSRQRNQRIPGERLPEEVQLREAEQVEQRVIGVQVHRHDAEFQQRAQINRCEHKRNEREREPWTSRNCVNSPPAAQEERRNKRARNDPALNGEQKRQPDRHSGRKRPTPHLRSKARHVSSRTRTRFKPTQHLEPRASAT